MRNSWIYNSIGSGGTYISCTRSCSCLCLLPHTAYVAFSYGSPVGKARVQYFLLASSTLYWSASCKYSKQSHCIMLKKWSFWALFYRLKRRVYASEEYACRASICADHKNISRSLNWFPLTTCLLRKLIHSNEVARCGCRMRNIRRLRKQNS